MWKNNLSNYLPVHFIFLSPISKFIIRLIRSLINFFPEWETEASLVYGSFSVKSLKFIIEIMPLMSQKDTHESCINTHERFP